MAQIQETIARLFPEAVITEGKMLEVEIADAQWHALAKELKENEALGFDFLVTIVGMDWTDKFGCVYYLTSTAHNEHISVKVTAPDREKPMLHSVADLWKIATIFEREVYDFFGIIFIGNPDMRRLFLSIDWDGYPLRKDYDESPEHNHFTTESERQSDFTTTYVENEDGTVEAKEVRVFEPNDFVVNIGPQHPATHGVLRFRTAVDGETVQKIDVYMGYIHRGIEKICEKLTYPQTLHFMDRLDYFSGHPYHHCLCMTIEEAAGIEISRRAQVIRVLMDENLTGTQKLRLMLKEMRVGAVNGLLLGVLSLAFIGFYIFLIKGKTFGFAFAVSGCIGFSLMVAMVISSITGTVIPMFFHKIKIDPAVASGPLITTVNDLVAVVTYYGMTWILLINIMQMTE